MKHIVLAALCFLSAFPLRAADPVPDTSTPATAPEKWTPDGRWRINDLARPWPPRVEPKSEAELAAAAQPPPGAVVLFDGTPSSLVKWRPTTWTVEDGCLVTAIKGGPLTTVDSYGSCRLHVEWETPNPPVGDGQNQGNSGVFLMSRYEMQILDNTGNRTYADGIAGAVYGENPPLAEANRPPGSWQYYDIVFLKPLFGPDGSVVRPATLSATLNGVPVQENYALWGPTQWTKRVGYKPHGDAPLYLQEHGCRDRFRNVWLVPIKDRDDGGMTK